MVTKDTTYFALFVVRVGATPLLHFTEAGQATVFAEACCVKYISNAHLVPVAAGLLKVKVVFSVKVWLKTLLVARLHVIALLVDVITPTVSNNAALVAAADAEFDALVADVLAFVALVAALVADVLAFVAEVAAADT